MNSNLELNPPKTIIGKAARLERNLRLFPLNLILFGIWFLGVAAIIVIGLSYSGMISVVPEAVYRTALVALALFLYYLPVRGFFINEMRNATVPLDQISLDIKSGKPVNLFEAFSFDLALALEPILSKGDKNPVPIFEAVIASSPILPILYRFGITKEYLVSFVKGTKWSSDLKIENITVAALDYAKNSGRKSVWVEDFFAVMAAGPLLPALTALKLQPADINNVVQWQISSAEKRIARTALLNPDHLIVNGGIGRDWAFGYTNFLRRYSVDITEALSRRNIDLEMIGKDAEIGQIEAAMTKPGAHNVLLVGDVGVGKKTTMLGFAKKVIDGTVPREMAYRHVFQVDVDAILSAADGLDLVSRLGQVLAEAAAAGNVIIFIEDVDRLLMAEAEGEANLAAVLVPFLDSGSVDLVCTLTTQAFNAVIQPNNALASRFSRVTVKEAKGEDLIKIIEESIPLVEARTGIFVSYEAIGALVAAAKRFMPNQPDPERSINLLFSVASATARERGATILLPKDVDHYLTLTFGVPGGETTEDEKAKLLRLEEEMHQAVVGQDEAIKAVSDAMRRARTQIINPEKPIGSFLFLGPTGVGKTATAKALANVYFGAESAMLRFDMSEYQNKNDIYRLIGFPQGQPGLLATAVREHPFSLLLFDEIEKANPDILNLFLQILDEGRLTDSNGEVVSFVNAIIILTSNAGANLIREGVAKQTDYQALKQQLTESLINDGTFKPEFLNRFTSVVLFSSLTPTEIEEITGLMVNKLAKTIKDNRDVSIVVTPDAIKKLAQLGFDPTMGARPLERVIQDKVESLIARLILQGKINKGDTFTVDSAMIV